MLAEARRDRRCTAPRTGRNVKPISTAAAATANDANGFTKNAVTTSVTRLHAATTPPTRFTTALDAIPAYVVNNSWIRPSRSDDCSAHVAPRNNFTTDLRMLLNAVVVVSAFNRACQTARPVRITTNPIATPISAPKEMLCPATTM